MGSVLYSKSLYGGRGIAGRLGFPVHEEEEEGGANVDAPFFLVCLRSGIPLPEEELLDLLPISYTYREREGEEERERFIIQGLHYYKTV